MTLFHYGTCIKHVHTVQPIDQTTFKKIPATEFSVTSRLYLHADAHIYSAMYLLVEIYRSS